MFNDQNMDQVMSVESPENPNKNTIISIVN